MFIISQKASKVLSYMLHVVSPNKVGNKKYNIHLSFIQLDCVIIVYSEHTVNKGK